MYLACVNAFISCSLGTASSSTADVHTTCDHHALGEKHSAADTRRRDEAWGGVDHAAKMRSLKPSPPISFAGARIHRAMMAVSIFDATGGTTGGKPTPPRMSADSAAVVQHVASELSLKNGTVVHAECFGRVGLACFDKLRRAAWRVLHQSGAGKGKRL